MKLFWIVSGIIFTLLGIIGLAIPVVPQVPFFVAGVLCFCKVSERLRLWILRQKLYQKYLAEHFDKFLKKHDINFKDKNAGKKLNAPEAGSEKKAC